MLSLLSWAILFALFHSLYSVFNFLQWDVYSQEYIPSSLKEMINFLIILSCVFPNFPSVIISREKNSKFEME